MIYFLVWRRNNDFCVLSVCFLYSVHSSDMLIARLCPGKANFPYDRFASCEYCVIVLCIASGFTLGQPFKFDSDSPIFNCRESEKGMAFLQSGKDFVCSMSEMKSMTICFIDRDFLCIRCIIWISQHYCLHKCLSCPISGALASRALFPNVLNRYQLLSSCYRPGEQSLVVCAIT